LAIVLPIRVQFGKFFLGRHLLYASVRLVERMMLVPTGPVDFQDPRRVVPICTTETCFVLEVVREHAEQLAGVPTRR
jgi:hypothetical protein